MLRKAFTAIVSLLFCLSVVYSSAIIDCSFKSASSCPSGKTLFYVPNFYDTGSNTYLSSPVSTFSDSNYNTALCCTSPAFDTPGDELMFNYENPTAQGTCPSGDQPLLYLSYYGSVSTNALITQLEQFDPVENKKVLCVKKPTQLSSVDIKISDNSYNYGQLGYTCATKFSSLESSRVSSCDATFGVSETYPFSLWIRGFESIASLKCSADCTSKVDNRVYSACATKVSSCINVPSACDGSLYGAWVPLNESHLIQCSEPWTTTKLDPTYSPTNTKGYEVTSNDEVCSNLLSQEFTVLFNNEPVKMIIYICVNDK
jgi:hypothetical protein